MNPGKPWIAMMFLFIAFFSFPFGYCVEQEYQAPEPRVEIITRPEWISGQVAVHVFTYPGDGATLEQNSVIVQVAVWGVSPGRPVYLFLDSLEAVRIETPGYYRYEWELAGSHHLIFRDDYMIFKTAEFSIAPPPPSPPSVYVSYMEEQLENQRIQVFTVMLVATLVGTPTGGYLKRKTKIFTEWALVPYGVCLLFGCLRLDQFYPLIPLGVSGAISYILAGGYAGETLVIVAEEGQLVSHIYTMDDEDHIVQGFGPRYWRTGFIDRAKIELVDHRYPIEFKGFGRKLSCILVAGEKNIETDSVTGKISVKCSPALAKALTKRGVIEKLEQKLADINYRSIFMERALNGVVSSIIMDLESLMGEMKIDQIGSVSEARVKVEEASKKIKEQLLDAENLSLVEEDARVG